MQFDAHSARALSRRVHSVHDCLFVIKQTVVQAAQAGEFEVSVALSDALPVVSVALHDAATPATAPVWAKRQEILRRAGFGAELIASDGGATLVVRW